MTELSERVLTRNESSRIAGVSTVPDKLMEPVCECVCVCVCDGRSERVTSLIARLLVLHAEMSL